MRHHSAGALRAQFREGGRRGSAAPAEHLLEVHRVVDVHRRCFHGRREQPSAHRPIPAGEGQLVTVHIQRRVGRERFFPVQQHPHRQPVVGHHRDGFQVSGILDAGFFPEALRMAARARLHRRHLAQPRRVVIADRQARLAAAGFHREAAARPGENPSQLRLLAAPGVDLDGPLKQRGQPFGEVLSRRAGHGPLGPRRRRAGKLETHRRRPRSLPGRQVHSGWISRIAALLRRASADADSTTPENVRRENFSIEPPVVFASRADHAGRIGSSTIIRFLVAD